MILIFVFVACLLTAFGGLYFLGAKLVFSNSLQASLAIIIGLLLGAGGEAMLAGSSSSFYKAQQIQTSACELEGESAHPQARGRDTTHVIQDHIVGCMKAAGYHWTLAHRHCQEAPVSMNPLCYLPDEPFSRAVTLAQVVFE
ncbi:hypothetical protein [Methylocystis bryophila]|uniref:Uncharacterized protein n=1 Tax=Methylocystis bryophila TaxID=655015 RepID=A0A1W6MZS7_9HYPH|nr:hypothetical protein [Methylocystis bryophila]ARN83075.1 hypothetical protein B1812_20545 [Methylocystis bryophila]BDV39388.1 hypothetical protein DSM21852_26410 [Methylocystis bryophila]